MRSDETTVETPNTNDDGWTGCCSTIGDDPLFGPSQKRMSKSLKLSIVRLIRQCAGPRLLQRLGLLNKGLVGQSWLQWDVGWHPVPEIMLHSCMVRPASLLFYSQVVVCSCGRARPTGKGHGQCRGGWDVQLIRLLLELLHVRCLTSCSRGRQASSHLWMLLLLKVGCSRRVPIR